MTGPVESTGGLAPPIPPRAPAAPPAPGAGPANGGVTAPRSATAGASFAQHLQRSSGGVEFSKHALERLQRRNISTGPQAMRRLEHGVEMAASKGARDAVVMVDDTAFVVSVRNRTVITAIDSAHMRQHVFTNIDSAVLA